MDARRLRNARLPGRALMVLLAVTLLGACGGGGGDGGDPLALSDLEAEAFDAIVLRPRDASVREHRRDVRRRTHLVLVAAVVVVRYGLGWPWASVGVFALAYLLGLAGRLLVMVPELLTDAGGRGQRQPDRVAS